MSEWKRTKLKKANIILIDCDHKTPEAQESGIPYIGIPQLKDGQIKFDLNPRLISEEDYVKWTSKANPQFNDIILSRRCNPGVTAFVPDGVKFALGQNLVLLRSVGNDVTPEYLRWMVQGRSWWDQVNKFLNSGAVFDSLKCKDIPNFEINLPPLPEQKAIAKILGDLDDKIELNRKMNQTLEEMTQALFKSWFVDFDPVLDNALSADPKSYREKLPEELHILAKKRSLVAEDKKLLNTNPELAKLFPNCFVFNETLGKWIPEGWEDSRLGDEFEITMGQSPPGSSYNETGEGVPFFQGKTDFSFRFPINRIFCTEPKRFAKKNDTLISVRAPVGNVNLAASDCSIGRGLGALKHKSNSISYTYYSLLQLKSVFDVFEGEGTVFGSINQQDLKGINIVKPDQSIIDLFDRIISKNDVQIESLSYQTETLTKLRDTLLPQLISGKLRVPEAMLEIQQTKN